MALEAALQEHGARVDDLLKQANQYLKAVKAWKRACERGNVVEQERAAQTASALAPALAEPTALAADSWSFDVGAYLGSDAWREELAATATEQFGLRVSADSPEGYVVSSPVIVESRPPQRALRIGRTRSQWRDLRPRVVAAELRRLRDRNDAAGAADLLEGLYGAWEYLTGSSGGAARFADIYRLFCLTPGWRKENPKPAFAQAIYALQRANIPMTRKGVAYQFDFPSGNPKESDVFSVVDDIGRNIRYYGITFLPQGR